MSTYVEDRLAIADLEMGWIHRDLGEWAALRELFHPDGVIEITWFEGLFTDFVDASERMGASQFRTKHVIASPVMAFNESRDRAVAETNAIIIGENISLGLGCMGHNRFIDRIEKRDGLWKIVDRKSIYDAATFTFPLGLVDIDVDLARTYPREYAALAYLLDKSGFPVAKVFATKGSDLEHRIKADAAAWLAAPGSTTERHTA
ncbi:nuclear transport factor 2 family protein [Pseudarthrobacter raffinosi]|uniref:nuclear transport factor 2 family protein n=1 Tax=Pseudarthrobacter raffinosi TaxID=2953651 RepID=UPI00208E71A9|nr:nuclear transport factor 2 family protein [Pseudarthrobacter sp. MDT3-9]MCO4251225.1 nuclear transport factor 2 family protein [Pseudarthrobacter sp. MDT3-9]